MITFTLFFLAILGDWFIHLMHFHIVLPDGLLSFQLHMFYFKNKISISKYGTIWRYMEWCFQIMLSPWWPQPCNFGATVQKQFNTVFFWDVFQHPSVAYTLGISWHIFAQKSYSNEKNNERTKNSGTANQNRKRPCRWKPIPHSMHNQALQLSFLLILIPDLVFLTCKIVLLIGTCDDHLCSSSSLYLLVWY